MTSQSVHSRSGTLLHIAADLDHFELESEMLAKVSEHYRHLEHLAGSLQKLGVDNAMTDQHVIEIYFKYKTELLRRLEKLSSP